MYFLLLNQNLTVEVNVICLAVRVDLRAKTICCCNDGCHIGVFLMMSLGIVGL